MIGVDLVDHHVLARPGLSFVVAPVGQWQPSDLVGPNYTGQPAVHSCYELL